MPKRRASSKISESLRLPKAPRPEQNINFELHAPCRNCHDLNPDLLAELKGSLSTTLAEVKESKENGCQFCRLLYETYNYYYQANDHDWPNFRFTLNIGSGTPVVIERRKIVDVRYPMIKLYAPLGMFPVV
jgi:hypothetical protein